ncbi:MAG: hypothetical protein ACD_39C00154G0001 [uncultured bacterium]|nr:MAG: hypothetical protein ACD_39C00154G0001 [uncultured bacterium]
MIYFIGLALPATANRQVAQPDKFDVRDRKLYPAATYQIRFNCMQNTAFFATIQPAYCM